MDQNPLGVANLGRVKTRALKSDTCMSKRVFQKNGVVSGLSLSIDRQRVGAF